VREDSANEETLRIWLNKLWRAMECRMKPSGKHLHNQNNRDCTQKTGWDENLMSASKRLEQKKQTKQRTNSSNLS